MNKTCECCKFGKQRIESNYNRCLRDGSLCLPNHSCDEWMEREVKYEGELADVQSDPVNHPSHYTAHPSGVECIQITEWMNFNIGNSMKYIWRAGMKGDAIEDLKKAAFYLDREIKRMEKLNLEAKE